MSRHEAEEVEPLKIDRLIVQTCVIVGGILIAGLLALIAFRPESATPIVVVITALASVGTSTVLTLRGIKSNAQKIDAVKIATDQTNKQTDGINSVLLANLQTLVKHVSGAVPLNTGEVEVIRDNVVNAQAQIDKVKGIQ